MSENVAPREAPDITFCKRHPQVETGLRCGRCDTPICPRCMVQTPVGARCPDCAQLRRLPTFDVRPQHYVRAVGAAVAVAAVLGTVWSVLPVARSFPFLLALISGLAAGEAVSRATNRKRSRELKAIAALAVPVTLWVSVWVGAAPFLVMAGDAGLLSLAETMATLAFRSVSSPFMLLGLAFGMYVATTRIDQ